MEKSMREGKRFAKHRSTIMIEGQRDSGAWQVDKGEGTPWLKKKELKKKGRRAEIVQKKRAGQGNLCNLTIKNDNE